MLTYFIHKGKRNELADVIKDFISQKSTHQTNDPLAAERSDRTEYVLVCLALTLYMEIK